MEMFGKNLRARGQELGLTDAEVARLAGISERRYGFYVTGGREPDLATLLKIADVLQISADDLLRPRQDGQQSPDKHLREQIQAHASALPPEQLYLLADVAKAFARHAIKTSSGDR